jgi:hypothetical protein
MQRTGPTRAGHDLPRGGSLIVPRNIRPGAEGPPSPGDDDHRDVVIGVGGADGGGQRVHQFGVHGIQLGGTIHRQGANRPTILNENGVVHVVLPGLGHVVPSVQDTGDLARLVGSRSPDARWERAARSRRYPCTRCCSCPRDRPTGCRMS